MISFLKNININNISISKKKIYTDNLQFYKFKDDLIIQINDLYSRFGLNSYFGEKKITIDLSFTDNHTEEINILNNIHLHLYNLIKHDLNNNNNKNNNNKKRKTKDFKKLEDLVRDSIYGKSIRCKVPNFLRVYSSNKVLLKHENIEPRVLLDCIIQFKGIWILNIDDVKKVWIDISLVQCRLETPIFLKDYSFLDSKENEKVEYLEDKNDNPIDNSIYDKYRNMVKMGIPKQAVKLKIEMDGLEYSEDIFISSPKLIMGSKTNKNINPKSISLNDMLKNNFKNGNFKSKLKKVDTNNNNNNNHSPNKYKPPKNMNVPTLDEIQNALKGLKKTSKI